MTPPITTIPGQPAAPPDHTQLPCEDGAIVHNFQEHPQSNLLIECLTPRLDELHPDGQYCIGCDSGIYWRHTNPPLDGCKAPDWFYVPGVPPMLEGQLRRSYVMWNEGVAPLVVMEYVSGDGNEERDQTPFKGKFWVYERGIRAAFYVIFDANRAILEVYQADRGRYRLIEPNERGRVPIEPWNVELGIWEGLYRKQHLNWLRVWDASTGELLPLAEERAALAEEIVDDARQALNEETERAEAEKKRADTAESSLADAQVRLQHLADKLRALGIDPEA